MQHAYLKWAGLKFPPWAAALLLAALVPAAWAAGGEGAMAGQVANSAAGPLAGNPVAGKVVFARCANCHQVGPSARGGFGPQLNGVIGRKAGSTADFKYSDALRNADFAWTQERLRAFVKSPNQVVPGNKMRFWGLSDERQIDDLLAYLRTQP